MPQPLDTVLSSLRARRTLLVLDNCEHVSDACAALAETVLRNCPELVSPNESGQQHTSRRVALGGVQSGERQAHEVVGLVTLTHMRTSLDWLGCATFRFTRGDLVVYLDAYMDRVSSAPKTGMDTSQVDRADWVMVGHSHFDHLWGAERIALQTGATIVGSFESIRIMSDRGVPAAQLMPVTGSERVRLSDDITVQVFPSLHSCIWARSGFAQSDEICLGDLGVTHQERLQRLAGRSAGRATLADEVREHLRSSQQSARGDGGALVYRFETPEGSLLYQDTCGYWPALLPDLRSDVAILAAAGRGNIAGEPVQGTLAQFVAGEVAQLHPRRVVLGHHDDWLPGVSTAVNVAPIRTAMNEAYTAAELIEMDYCAGFDIFSDLIKEPARAYLA